jgi:hypothetical protein
VVGLTFSLYELPEGGSPLWVETQSLTLDSLGHYTALLGANSSEGLPLDLFTSSKALWLGVQPQLPGEAEQPRMLLVAVPYALKSSDADTLGGLPASAYMLSANQNATAEGGSITLPIPISPPGSGGGTTSTSITGAGTANYAAMFTGSSTIGNSAIYNRPGGFVGIGTTLPTATLDVNGTGIFTGSLMAASLALPDSASSSVGVLTLGGVPFLHDCCGGNFNANTFLGRGAGNFTTFGSQNTASGEFALGGITYGNDNTASGVFALRWNTTGYNNTAVGAFAGSYFNGTTEVPTTGSNSTFVGAFAGATVDNLFNATAIGFSAQVAESNALVLGCTTTSCGSGTTPPYVGIGTATPHFTLDVQGTGNFTGGVTVTGLTAGNCVQAGTGGLLATTASPCGSGGSGGTVTSVGSGPGLTGGPITTSGTLRVDTSLIATNASVASAVSAGVTTAENYANSTFLPLAGGTLSGNLVGTTANFSGNLQASGGTFGGNLTASGTLTASGGTVLPTTGTATSGSPFPSNPFDLFASSFNGTSAVNEQFRWQAEGKGSSDTGTLNLLSATGSSSLQETGLSIASNGQISFASGQTFPVTGTSGGTVTSVGSGAGLTGGPITTAGTLSIATGGVTNAMLANPSVTLTPGPGLSGGGIVTLGGSVTFNNTGILTIVPANGVIATGGQTLTLSIDPTVVPQLTAPATFANTLTISSGDLSVNSGNLNLPGTTGATGGVLNLGGTPFIHDCCPSSISGLAYYYNTFVGLSAGNFTSTGTENTGIGFQALKSTSGSNNTASGAYALAYNTTGTENTASGAQALINTVGNYNTASGFNALFANTTGSYNTAVGWEAGSGTPSYFPATGSYSTFVGANAAPTADGFKNATAIGSYARVAESDALVLGCTTTSCPSGTTPPFVGIGTATPAATLEVNGTAQFDGLVTFLAAGQTFPPSALTNLNASNLTSGTVPSAVLSGYYSNALTLSNSSNDIFGNFSGNGAGLINVNASYLGSQLASSFATLGSNSFAGTQMIMGSAQVDSAGMNGGAETPGVTFGVSGGGESISSNRTGAVNQYGLDFYTDFTPQMSITNAGWVGIGTQAPGSVLDVEAGNYEGPMISNACNDNTNNCPTLLLVSTAEYLEPILYTEGGGGSCFINNHGDLGCTGTKSAVVPVDSGARQVALYAVEAPENWFEDAGSGQLSNGSTLVAFEPTFAQTVNTGVEYHVFLTPKGDCEGLYVTNETAGGFEVHELRGGHSNIEFDYRVMARRKGYESVRLADKTKTMQSGRRKRPNAARVTGPHGPAVPAHSADSDVQQPGASSPAAKLQW